MKHKVRNCLFRFCHKVANQLSIALNSIDDCETEVFAIV